VAEKIGEGLNAIPPVFDLNGPIFDTRKYVSWIRINHLKVSRAKSLVSTEMSNRIGLLSWSAGISSTSAIIRRGLNDIGSRPPRAGKHILATNCCAWHATFPRSGSRGG
jgi:hypothetical protein